MTDGRESSDEQKQPRPPGNGSREDHTTPVSPKGTSGSSKRHFARLTSARKRQAQNEFLDWKRTLIEMIKTGSRLEVKKDGSWQFLLPPDLVRVVWETTVRERAAFLRQEGSASPDVEAVKSLQAEVHEKATSAIHEQATQIDRVVEATRGAVKTSVRAELPRLMKSPEEEAVAEKEAAAKLAQYREQLVKKQTEPADE
jgi:hypothetical protein